jgi:RNA polymerase sigma factor (sigma-70 family)
VRHGFATTRWSVIFRASDPALAGSTEAMETLCRAYWYPLYAFIRRHNFSPERAEDLTQGFFARLLEKDFLSSVEPCRGRFRTFLLTCLKRFLANEAEREHAIKRGGGQRVLSIDVMAAEGRYALEAVNEKSPEELFERRWAMVVLERALQALAEEMHRAGKQHLFAALKGYLVADASAGYGPAAKALGLSENSAKVAVHRLRRKYREKVVAEIRATVDTEAEVDEEIDRLFKALAG